MHGALSGLACSVSWGAGDFAGGIAAKRQNVFVVVALSQVIGLVLMAILALLSPETIPGRRDLLWGAAAGLSGGVGVTCLYAALSSGRMGIAAPVTGVIAAILPAAYTWFVGGVPSWFTIAGMTVAFGGIALVSMGKADRPSRRVMALAVGSGLGFAGFLLLIGLSSRESFLWTLTSARVGSSFLLLAIVALTRPGFGRPSWAVLAAALGDTAGNAFFLFASMNTRLDIAVVLSALYPITTVALARFVLRERLTLAQTAGAALMLVAIPLLVWEA